MTRPRSPTHKSGGRDPPWIDAYGVPNTCLAQGTTIPCYDPESEQVLRKIHDCTFRPKYFLRHFFAPNSPGKFNFISKNSVDLF